MLSRVCQGLQSLQEGKLRPQGHSAEPLAWVGQKQGLTSQLTPGPRSQPVLQASAPQL